MYLSHWKFIGVIEVVCINRCARSVKLENKRLFERTCCEHQKSFINTFDIRNKQSNPN